MTGRALKILQHVNRSPSRAVCSVCNREFRTPLSVLHKTSEAWNHLNEMFERHECEEKPNYDKQKWVELFQSAFMELEHAKITGRIGAARTAISARIEILRNLPGLHTDEQRGIEDALRTLRFLEKQEARYQESEKHRLLDEALSKLRAIEPKVMGL